MSITEISIKRPSLIIIIFIALTVIGLFSYKLLKYDLLPKMSPPVVVITTTYPGASPEEVETNVTKPIEDAVASLDKISMLNSTSAEGVSFITIELDQSAKSDIALQDAQRKISPIISTLPEGCKEPQLSKISLDETPVLRMAVTASMPSKEFNQFLIDNVQPRLTNVPGVGQLYMFGGDEREIKVNLDYERLKANGLSIAQVTQAVKSANMDFPTGKIDKSERQFIVRLAGKFTGIEQFKDIVIGTSKAGGEIRLRDIAEVQDGQKDYTRINRLNGKQAIGLFIVKQADANSVEVSKLARKVLTDMENEYKGINLKFDIAQDSSEFTVAAAGAVVHDLELAVILVALVMLVFLHSLRNSLIVMVAIPASMVSTFIGMYLFGFTLNLMTLLGLSLVVGILVDDSIVVLENIYRHLEMGKDSRQAALDGRNEIGFTALSITLVDVVVFLPLSLLPGVVGNIMREFSIVVLLSTMMSLFVSFTITPMLASRFSKVQHLSNATIGGRLSLMFENAFSALQRGYEALIRICLNNKTITAALAIGIFMGSVQLAKRGFIGSEFFKASDKGEFSVVIELPTGSSFENTNAYSRQVEDMISKMPEVARIYANVGSSTEGFLSSSSNNISEIIVTLVPKEERKYSTDDMIEIVKEKVAKVPGVRPRVNPIGIFGSANMTPLQLIVSGSNPDSVAKSVNIVQNIVRNTGGTTDIRLSVEDGKPEARVKIDRQKLGAYGLSVGEVGQTLQIALRGDDESTFRDGNTEYDIRIWLDEFDRSNIENLKHITFVNKQGQQIELQQFAEVTQSIGPAKLQRQNRNAAVTIFAQVKGRGVGDVANEIDAAIAKAKLPIGIQTNYTGDVKNQRESAMNMGLAVLAAIIFVYMIMVALYDSFIYPFVVLFSIPLAVIGAFLALALTMNTFNTFTQLGLIMLVGLVAKNAILLVDFANEQKKLGKNSFEALVEAGKERLRPILMTTIAMVIGMLPIAMAKGAGGEWKNGLGWVLIGGLSSSMFLTLVFVPVVYLTVDNIIAFIQRIVGNRKKKSESGNAEMVTGA